MEVSGSTSHQVSNIAALTSTNQTSQVKRTEEAQQAAKALETQQANQSQASTENRPVAGNTVGSIINTSA
ncbi:hypothetical protein [Sulfurirhabdus autotrophica]|uniref:Uncharacterized protein n=1 Tax=Sulfurirhabdus autotrophica TaxID=1706046 RepID=A0A4V6P3X8_9PROT|nr:hypothetical protein [Sulfurirhabdus autotrophica]TCV87479.1 hypothetical protein EDC63_105148 [Sulfurirhabdus autotrophica]